MRFLHLWEEGRGWWAVPPLVPEFSSLRARRLLANEGHGPADARGKRVQHRLSHRLSYNRSIDFCDLLRSLVKNLKTCWSSTRSTELKLDTSGGSSYTCKVPGFNSVVRSTGTVHLYVRRLLIYTEGRSFFLFFIFRPFSSFSISALRQRWWYTGNT